MAELLEQPVASVYVAGINGELSMARSSMSNTASAVGGVSICWQPSDGPEKPRLWNR